MWKSVAGRMNHIRFIEVRGVSSVGRALLLHGKCHGFESHILQLLPFVNEEGFMIGSFINCSKICPPPLIRAYKYFISCNSQNFWISRRVRMERMWNMDILYFIFEARRVQVEECRSGRKTSKFA